MPLTVSIADDVREYAEGQVAAGRYASLDEYFNELARAEQERQIERIKARVTEAMKSPSEEATPEWWAKLEADVQARAATRQRP